MTYNIHPIFVHFPIAFLVVYSFIKLIPFRKWFPKVAWEHIELVLLVAGVLGAFVSSSTGEIAEHLTKAPHNMVEMHAFFAGATTWLYMILLVGAVLPHITVFLAAKFGIPKITNILVKVGLLINNRTITFFLALFGLVAISLTGLLGGALVYGTTADPFAKIILQALGLN